MKESKRPNHPPLRVFVAGTDTAVGKTAISCALLQAARRRHQRALPYKPAQSGSEQPTDAERLTLAADLPGLHADEVAPLQYERPLAPGMAEDMRPFLQREHPQDLSALTRVTHALASLEAQHHPHLTVIEGAGGLFVPMPGGTWQPTWISHLCAPVLLIVRPNLGTINHTWLTLHALADADIPVAGLVLNRGLIPESGEDESLDLNRQLLAAHPEAPLLGEIPRLDEAANVTAQDSLFDALCVRLRALSKT